MARRARKPSNLLVPARLIEQRIYLIRGCLVMLDRDLAALYKVRPTALRQQVKRNQTRFPDDFMFQLTADEADALVSQFVTPSHSVYGGSLPYAFSEQGVAMLATVLKSPRAVQVSIGPITAQPLPRRRLHRA